MGTPATWSNLGRVRKRSATEDSTRTRLRALLLWAPPMALLLLAALGAILADEAALTAIYLAVALVCAGLLGWRAGSSSRAALEQEIDDRSGELHRALTELEDRAVGDRAAAVDGGRVPR